MIIKSNEIPECPKEIPEGAVVLYEEFRLQKRTKYKVPELGECFHTQDIPSTTATSVAMFDKIFKEVENEDPDYPGEDKNGIMSFTIYDVSFDFSFSVSEERAMWLYQIKNFVEIIFLNLFQFVSYSKSTDNKFKLIIKEEEGSILIEHPYIIDTCVHHYYQ